MSSCASCLSGGFDAAATAAARPCTEPQHCLNFLPLPQTQVRCRGGWCRVFRRLGAAFTAGTAAAATAAAVSVGLTEPLVGETAPPDASCCAEGLVVPFAAAAALAAAAAAELSAGAAAIADVPFASPAAAAASEVQPFAAGDTPFCCGCAASVAC